MLKNSRLFVKILCYFLTLSLLTGIVGIMLYSYFVRQRENDFEKHIAENMSSVHDQFTEYITTLSNVSGLFFSNSVVQMNFVPYDQMTKENIIMTPVIVSDIAYYQNILDNSTIIDICAYADDQRVYYNQGTSDSKSFFTRTYLFDDYDYEFWKNLLHTKRGMRILNATCLTKYKSVKQLVIPIVHTVYNNGNLCVFASILSVNALVGRYYNSSVFEESEFVVLDTTGKVLYNRLGLPQDGFQSLSRIDRYGKTVIDHVNYSVVVDHYDAFGWGVYCLTPTDAMMKANGYYLFIAVGMCAGILLIAFILSFVYSKKIYAPILGISRDIDRLLGTDKYRSVDELKYISFRLTDVAKYADNAKEFKHTYSRQYIKAKILEILDGRFISDEQLLQDALTEEYGFTGSHYACILCRGEGVGMLGDVYQRGGKLLITHGTDFAICVLGTDSTDDAQFNHWIAEIEKNGLRYGIGRAYEGLHGICSSYEGAANMFRGMEIHNWSYAFDRSGFAAAIRMHDQNKVDEHINDLMDRLNAEWPGFARAREAVECVYDAAIHVLGREIYQYCDALKMAAYDYLGVLLANEGIDGRPLSHFASMTMSLIPVVQSTAKNAILAQRIKNYIDLHYFEELSLDIIADTVGVSGKYVSKIFKDELNINVSDYIALVRVEHAKQLIDEGIAMNIVAQHVGIESRATFNRIFKKSVGMTPSEYREKK